MCPFLSRLSCLQLTGEGVTFYFSCLSTWSHGLSHFICVFHEVWHGMCSIWWRLSQHGRSTSKLGDLERDSERNSSQRVDKVEHLGKRTHSLLRSAWPAQGLMIDNEAQGTIQAVIIHGVLRAPCCNPGGMGWWCNIGTCACVCVFLFTYRQSADDWSEHGQMGHACWLPDLWNRP